MNYFKKSFLLITLFFGLLISCSSDDTAADAQPKISVTQSQLEGEWNLLSIVATTRTEVELPQGKAITTSEQVACDIDYKVTFSEEDNTVISEGTYRQKIKTETTTNLSNEAIKEEQSIIVDTSDPNFGNSNGSTFSGGWKLIDENTIEFTEGQTTYQAEIVNFSDTSFEISYDLSQIALMPEGLGFDFSGGDFDIKISGKSNAVFGK